MIELGKRQGRPSPPDRPFEHTPGCRLKDARPEWEDRGRGVWKRTCRCRSETWYAPSTKLDPASESPEPDPAFHHKAGCRPDCPGAANPTLVLVKRNERDGGWISQCMVSGSTLYYWWDADQWQKNDDGDMVHVTRRGPVLFQYEARSSG